MKAGWAEVPLEEVCTFQRGLTYKKSDEVEVGGKPVLRAGNVSLETGEIVYDDLRRISDHVDIPPAKMVKRGALLICTASGSKSHLGKSAPVVKEGYAFGGFMAQVTAKNGLDPSYMRWLFQSPRYWDHLGALAAGMNINNLKFDQLRDLPVPLPPIEEQRRIVAVLDKAFEGLARARANVEANVADADEYRAVSLDKIFRKQSSVTPRSSLAAVSNDFGRGRSRHRPRNDPALYDGPYPFLQTGDIREAPRYVVKHSQSYNLAGLAQSKLWPTGTVCITIAANIAETAILSYESCFPDSVIGCVVDESVTTPEYVEYVVRSFSSGLKSESKGSAQDNINLGTFERAMFPFPDKEKQTAACERMGKIEDQVDRLQRSYRRTIKDMDNLAASLLSCAFRGELV